MNANALCKVYYRPMEAAIRWAGLLRYERDILKVAQSSRQLPTSFHCPRWPELRLCADRIYDAIFNGELPYGRDGITSDEPSLRESPDLTIRHVDLKRWMHQHYPEHRPAFLFSRRERMTHPIITIEAGQAMLIEREALKTQLHRCRQDLQSLQEQQDGLLKQGQSFLACAQCPTSDRAEATYLHIVGAMLSLMLGQSPSGQPYSSFKSQEAVISALIAYHGGAMGISERTLQTKFALARRRLRSMAA